MSNVTVTQTGGATTAAVTVSRGLQGPTGATGPEGTITNSSVNTAIATNPSATRTAAGLVIGTDVAAQGDTRIEPQVKSSSFTASNGETYHVVASATVTDPSPVEGKGFSVLVRNGTATVGGTAYGTAGTIIVRTFHSGGWSNYSYQQASAFDPAGSAAAQIVAKSTPKLYEDFSNYPDNTTLALGASPRIGNPWRWSAPSSIAPLITGGYLRGTSGALFYFGNDVGEKIRTISFEVEFVADGAGASNIGTTYGFHNVPVLTETGAGIPALGTPNFLHFIVTENGLQAMGFNEGTGAAFETMQPMGRLQTGDGSVPYSSNIAGGSLLGRGRHIISFTFVGDTCLVTVLGTTYVYRHPPARRNITFSGLPTDGDQFMAGGVTYTWRNALTTANEVKIGGTSAVCVTNAIAALNASAGSGSLYGTGTVQNPLVRGASDASTILTLEARLAGPSGNLITCSESSSATTIGGSTLAGGERTPIAAAGEIRHWWYESMYNLPTYRGHARLYSVAANAPESFDLKRQESIIARLITNGAITFDQTFTFSGAVTFSGAITSTSINGLKGTPYTGWPVRPPVYALQSKTSVDTSSTAGMVYTAGALLAMEGRQPASAGAVNVYEISGFFADTANDRRIALNEAFSGDIFDSGVLAAASVRNKAWMIRVTMQQTGSHGKRWKTEFTVSGNPTIIQHDAVATTTAATINLRCDSVAAGDVQVFTYHSKSEFVP